MALESFRKARLGQARGHADSRTYQAWAPDSMFRIVTESDDLDQHFEMSSVDSIASTVVNAGKEIAGNAIGNMVDSTLDAVGLGGPDKDPDNKWKNMSAKDALMIGAD